MPQILPTEPLPLGRWVVISIDGGGAVFATLADDSWWVAGIERQGDKRYRATSKYGVDSVLFLCRTWSVARVEFHPVFADRTSEEYANAASRVALARERVLSDASAKAVHDALMAKIEDRLAAKHATRAEVRRAIGLTQNQMADTLGMTQGDISKLERRNNLNLTTLRRFIEATGGRLRISATYGTTEVDLHIGDLLASDNTTETATTNDSSMR